MLTPDYERHTLATIRAEYARYQQTGDLHELARAVGQILGGPDGDMLPVDERTVVAHPDEETNAHG